jgi:heat shock protein HslJ
MKKLFLMAVLITTILMCGFTQENELMGKNWRLAEVRINDVNTGFIRSDLPRLSMTAVGNFTLIIDAETISGVGAPNRYIASYTRTDNQISVSSMATTKVALGRELDKLKEREYLTYLQNTDSWKLVNINTLELSSKTADGKAVLLIFNL